MTLNTRVADDQLGRYYRKTAAIADRLGKSLDFEQVMSALQRIHDGKFGTAVLTPATDTFRLTVDYGQTLEQMIAAGRYDWKNDDITAKRFPVEGKGIVEFEGRYFHFNRNISSENAVGGIELADTVNPWSPAKIEHVLSHGATFPEEQRKFPIVGLGSVAEVLGPRRVPCLGRGDSRRSLGLYWWRGGWHPLCRFLAVRKVSGS